MLIGNYDVSFDKNETTLCVEPPICHHRDILPIFTYTCIGGHLQLATALARQFHVTSEDVLENFDNIFTRTCYHGHVDVIDWLMTEYDDVLTKDVIERNHNFVLRMVCAGGNVSLFKSLQHRFGFTVEDVRSLGNDAFITACKNGHLDVMEMLWGTFKLTLDDVRSKRNLALRYALLQEHDAILEWLMSDKVGLTREEILNAWGIERECTINEVPSIIKTITKSEEKTTAAQ